MAVKTALNWALHVKHSCANRGRHVMVNMENMTSFLFVITPHPQTLKRNNAVCNEVIWQTFQLMTFVVLGSYSLFILLLLGNRLLIFNVAKSFW